MKRQIHLALALAFVLAPRPAAAQAGPEVSPGEASSVETGAEPGGSVTGGSVTGGSVTERAVRDDATVRSAQSHFRRGVQLYQESNYDGALAEFTRAYELVPNYRILYNLGQTHAERHDYVAAVKLFDDYLEQGGSDVPGPRRQATERERASLVERIATLQIESNIDGAELFVDGQSQGVGSRSRAIALNPGLSELRLQKRGYEPVTRRLNLAGGDSLSVELSLEPAAALEAPAGGALARSSAQAVAPSRTGLWVSGITAGLLTGATVTFAVLATNANRELDAELRQLQTDPRSTDETRSRVRTYAALTDGFGVASALAVGSVIYFLLSPGERPASSSDRAALAPRAELVLSGSGVAIVGGF